MACVSAPNKFEITPISKTVGLLCVRVSDDGGVAVKGYGQIDKQVAEDLAGSLVLLASKLRNAARNSENNLLLN